LGMRRQGRGGRGVCGVGLGQFVGGEWGGREAGGKRGGGVARLDDMGAICLSTGENRTQRLVTQH